MTPRNLALSSGLANLALAAFGALPMCHGADGLAAHHRFGARTGLAPVLIGVLLLGLCLIFAERAADLLALIPLAAVGALLLFSAADLAFSRRPVRCPAVVRAGDRHRRRRDRLDRSVPGLLAGGLAEIGRAHVIELLHRLREPG